jgi:hypothetical protein
MTQPRPLPPLKALREVLAYDPDTGALTWRVTTRGKVRAGSPAGTLDWKGYIRVQVGPRKMAAHRVAWYLHHGTDPGPAQVDHINRDRSDNRASNLRLVDAKGNSANSVFIRPVQVIYPSGEVRLFSSGLEAASALGCSRASICRYAKGLCPHPAGLVISYVT